LAAGGKKASPVAAKRPTSTKGSIIVEYNNISDDGACTADS